MNKYNLPISNNDSNSSFEFFGTDAEQVFKDNMSTLKRDRLVQLGWHSKSITYNFDDLGFRNPNDIDRYQSALALGCSYTMGIGLPIDSIWPTILSNLLGYPVYNGGLSGSSTDTAFRILLEYIPKYKPRGVYLFAPSMCRTEYISDYNNCVYHLGSWSKNKDHLNFLKFRMHQYKQEIDMVKNLLAMEQLCNSYNIPFHYFKSDDINFDSDITDDLARDLLHPGRPFQHRVADHMLYLNKNKLTHSPASKSK